MLLQEAKHPLLVLGAGANRKMTSKMLRQFVETTKIPYCTTQMGKGVIDSREAAASVDCQAERFLSLLESSHLQCLHLEWYEPSCLLVQAARVSWVQVGTGCWPLDVSQCGHQLEDENMLTVKQQGAIRDRSGIVRWRLRACSHSSQRRHSACR
jgi:Thiamine pyrophosphate enzyme, central domain